MASSSRQLLSSAPSASAISCSADADGVPPLEKPSLPKRPPPPDLRHVTDPVVKAMRLQEHVAELVTYDELKEQYDEELYPAFRAEQRRRGAAAERERRGCRRQPPPPVPQPPLDPAAMVPPQLLYAVRQMYEHFGWLNFAKLGAEMDPNRRAPGSGKRQQSAWFAALPADLREKHWLSRDALLRAALRVVRRERKAAGRTVFDRKNQLMALLARQAKQQERQQARLEVALHG